MNPALLLGIRKNLMSAASVSPADAKEKIAFDLMTKIAEAESAQAEKAPENPKDYYLKLYSHCLRIVSGEDIEDVLEDDA